MSHLWEKEICWALKEFEFTNENQYFDPVLDFTKEAVLDDIYDFGNNADDASNGDDNEYDFGYAENDNGQEEEGNQFVSHHEYIPSAISSGQDSLFSYFDTTMLRNWAGPEHWRSRPLRGDYALSVMISQA